MLSAEGRLSAYILGGLPPFFVLYLSLTQPDYVAPLFNTTLGLDDVRRRTDHDDRRHLLDEEGRKGGGVAHERFV